LSEPPTSFQERGRSGKADFIRGIVARIEEWLKEKQVNCISKALSPVLKI
jgi:hypothetical protein